MATHAPLNPPAPADPQHDRKEHAQEHQEHKSSFMDRLATLVCPAFGLMKSETRTELKEGAKDAASALSTAIISGAAALTGSTAHLNESLRKKEK